jgi:cysteinyl-tRNA synthetase
MHNGFVRVDEEKMSKSLGNFFLIRDMLERHHGETLRFMILKTHYRKPLEFWDSERKADTKPPVREAEDGLKRLYSALKKSSFADVPVNWEEVHAQRFRAAMDDDFGTPEAIAVLFDLASEIYRGRTELGPQLKALGGVLGLLQRDPQLVLLERTPGKHGADLAPEGIESLVAARVAAKKRKDFVQADRIRDQLRLFGIVVEDSGNGTEWRRGSAFRLLEMDELEDFRAEVVSRRLDVRDFRISENADKGPAVGIYSITGNVDISYVPNGKTLRLRAGSGSTWVVQFANELDKGYFS